jgi:hypothetical protein
LPIVKGVYLLRVQSIVEDQPETSTATELRFGVWGVCASSALNRPSLLTNNGQCFGPKLGYEVPASLLSLIGIYSPLVTIVLKGLLILLILHPIIAGLSLLSFVFSLFLGSHPFSIFALVVTIISALLSSLVFATDLALVVVARSKVSQLQGLNFRVGFGNGIWMMLVGVSLTWLAVILLSARACYCCGVRRKEPEPWYSEDVPDTEAASNNDPPPESNFHAPEEKPHEQPQLQRRPSHHYSHDRPPSETRPGTSSPATS